MEIFKLVGSIFVDSDEAQKSISKTDTKAQGVGTTLANGIKTAGKWGAAIVTGAATAVSGVTALTVSVSENMGEIDDAAKKVGTTAEEYQKWSYAAKLGGMETEKLNTLMVKQQKTFADAKEGSTAAAEAYARLGLDINNIGNSGEAFNSVIAKLADMEDETTRNALANDIFGKSYADLAPLLAEGSEGIEAWKQECEDLGGVISNDTVEAGAELGDMIDRVKTAFSGAGAKLLSTVFPIVSNICEFIISNMPKIQTLFESLAPIITQLLEGLLPPLMDLASQIFPLLIDLITAILPPAIQIVQAVLPIIVNLLAKLLPPIIQIVQTLLPPLLELLMPILDLLTPLIELLQPILDLVTAILGPIAELISGLLTPLIKIISKLIEIAIVPLQGYITALTSQIGNDVKSALAFVMNGVNTVKGVFTGLIQFIKGVFTGDWKAAWEGVKQIFSSIWEGIKGAFKIPINWIINGINSFIKGINKIKIPDWVPAVGGKGFNISLIPNLATGCVLEKGQTGFLEGNGAEAVVPLENNRKWIRNVANDMDEAMGGGNKTVTILTAILQALEELTGAGIYLDTERLVGSLAGPLDKRLGQIALQKARA